MGFCSRIFVHDFIILFQQHCYTPAFHKKKSLANGRRFNNHCAYLLHYVIRSFQFRYFLALGDIPGALWHYPSAIVIYQWNATYRYRLGNDHCFCRTSCICIIRIYYTKRASKRAAMGGNIVDRQCCCANECQDRQEVIKPAPTQRATCRTFS